MVSGQILVGKGEVPCLLEARYANRHGLIAGATGTGKTVTLQVLAEGFSDLGIPVFLADVKGDLAGLSQAGKNDPKLIQRAQSLGKEDFQFRSYPVIFWDVFSEQGHPVRSTISEMGPLLLARLMELNDVQTGVLNLIFKYADDNGLLLLDMKDLKALVSFASENTEFFGKDYGTVSKQSLGIIQRGLLSLEEQGADKFFGEPTLKLKDFMQTTLEGRGHVNILAAENLFANPKLYATFLLWLLSELFETLPETGDVPLPKMVFFFDEAHLLFNDASKVVLEKVEQVVRLIRSKGVGVYFITQNPLDVPEKILSQLGNRVQHALRAFTPKDQKSVKAAAETFRAKPGLDVATVITELAVGEALVSMLGEGGVPSPVERAKICPPQSRIGTITTEERQTVMSRSPFKDQYTQTVDRESAYEKLQARTQEKVAEPVTKKRSVKEPDSVWEIAAKSAVRAASSKVGREIGRSLLRGILGSLSKK
nr:helicase HerA-like domain-containing protein [uncultured Bdellovibrio sp.]